MEFHVKKAEQTNHGTIRGTSTTPDWAPTGRN